MSTTSPHGTETAPDPNSDAIVMPTFASLVANGHSERDARQIMKGVRIAESVLADLAHASGPVAVERDDDCGACIDEPCEIPETCAYHVSVPPPVAAAAVDAAVARLQDFPSVTSGVPREALVRIAREVLAAARPHLT